jgi:hypothetical protein
MEWFQVFFGGGTADGWMDGNRKRQGTIKQYE